MIYESLVVWCGLAAGFNRGMTDAKEPAKRGLMVQNSLILVLQLFGITFKAVAD